MIIKIINLIRLFSLNAILRAFKKKKYSVAILSSYFESDKLPVYVKDYLLELSRFFDRVILVTTADLSFEFDQNFLFDHGIQTQKVINEGFDFGMHTKIIKDLDVNRINRLGLFNDSVILCGSLAPFFKWEKESKSHVLGIIDSNELNYHLQSYFLIFKRTSINYLKKFLTKHNLHNEKLEIIETFEIGLTQKLLKRRFSIDSFFKVDDLRYEFNGNPSFLLLKELLGAGFPLIKKKIFTGKFNKGEVGSLEINNFDFSSKSYLEIIKKVNPNYQLPLEFH